MKNLQCMAGMLYNNASWIVYEFGRGADVRIKNNE